MPSYQFTSSDGTHLTAAFVESHLNTAGQFQGFVDEGESAWNPASTKRAIYGPALITYTRYQDGGWHVQITEPSTERE